jgi:hypothetical protein
MKFFSLALMLSGPLAFGQVTDSIAYTCKPMAPQDRLAQPPPRPEGLDRFGVTPTSQPAQGLCPEGEVPYYDYAVPTRRAQTRVGTYWYASAMQATDSVDNRGVGAAIRLFNPYVYNIQDMSVAEISIVKGTNYHLVEIGSRKFNDSFPRLMISRWA